MVDRQPEMLARAAAKGLETLEADAQRLPLRGRERGRREAGLETRSLENPAAALAEARRILRPKGHLALMVFTREDVADTWLDDYFPGTRAWMFGSFRTPPSPHYRPSCPAPALVPVAYTDLEDGSLAALAGHPEKLADPRWHRQTSYFERLERERPEELRAGLERSPRRSRSRPRAEKARPRDRAGLRAAGTPPREPEGEAVPAGSRDRIASVGKSAPPTERSLRADRGQGTKPSGHRRAA